MIAPFPEFYPDELVYSVLARYYTQSGYMRYTFAAEDLFQAKTVRPDPNFVNLYTSYTLEMLTRKMSMEDVILKHTMFPYYGRFLNKERRNQAFQALVKMQGNYHNLLPMQKSKDGRKRHLRYCPVCVKEDREKYGETYWHRVHQMIGIEVCPKHGCHLVDAVCVCVGKASPDLKSAEESVQGSRHEILKPKGDLDENLARYMSAVFESEMDLKDDIPVGKFLHSRLEGTPYCSLRGEQRNIGKLHEDFTEYYKELSSNYFTELWQIQKVFTNDRMNFNEICMIAMFLEIPVEELVNMRLPEKASQERFDEEIYRLHEQGLKYPQIAEKLGASYDVVKAIGERRYGTYHREPRQSQKVGSKAYDWQKIDKDTLPKVQEVIQKSLGDGIERPQKITIYAIERALNLPSKRIALYLPMCKAEIEKYRESQEAYWVREILWAIEKLKRDGKAVHWKNIRDLTNIRKKDFLSCSVYLKKSNEYQSIINNLN